jgi:hypothetical protein
MFIFVDEASKGKEEERRTMGYGPKGEPLEVDAWYDTHSRNYTLIAAATLQEGFFKPACEVVGRNHGSNDSDPTHGSVRFVLLVREQLVPQIGNAVACERAPLSSWTTRRCTTIPASRSSSRLPVRDLFTFPRTAP